MSAAILPWKLYACLHEDDVDSHRHFDCYNYEECIGGAIASRWRSWSCSRCPTWRVEGGPVPAHSYSSSSDWVKCRRLYQYRHLFRVRPVPGVHLRQGKMLHWFLELFLADHEASYAAIMREVMAGVDKEWLESPDAVVEIGRVQVMCQAYAEVWGESRRDWKVIATEQDFVVPLADGVVVKGKIDMLARHIPSGDLYVIEHKSTSMDISDPLSDYWSRLDIDEQIAIYCEAVTFMYGERPRVMYDVVRKDKTRPKAKATIRRRKSETDEEWTKRKAENQETVEEWQARLLNDMTENKEKFFQRKEIPRTEEQQKELIAERLEIMKEIDRYTGIYPRNSESCSSKYGTCPYLGVCRGTESLDGPKFVRIGLDHKEIKGEDNDDTEF